MKEDSLVQPNGDELLRDEVGHDSEGDTAEVANGVHDDERDCVHDGLLDGVHDGVHDRRGDANAEMTEAHPQDGGLAVVKDEAKTQK
jgi:hypothetical protein